MPASRKTDQSIWWFFAFLIAYFSFEACFVRFIALGAGLDDAELISNLSFWSWGYGGSQPPLYTWLAYGLTSVFGLHFALLQFLRFTLLASGFFAVYLGLRLLQVARPLAAFAVLSMFLLPQIGWESQRALIHSVLGTAGSAWSFAAFVWFVCRPGYQRALCLALAISMAVLGKYNGLIFIGALFMSGFFLPPVGRALCTRYFAAAVAMALALMAPALVFMLLHPQSVVERSIKFRAGAGGNWFIDRLAGGLDLLRAGFSFVLPALAAALLIAAIVWLKQRRRAAPRPAGGEQAAMVSGRALNRAELPAAMRFLRVVLLSALALCALMVLVSGATHIKDRWLQPVLFLAPPYAALWLAWLDKSGRSARAFGLLGLIAACIVPPMLYANLYARSGKARPPIQNLDYPALYAGLRANGPIAAVLAPEPFYAGNLRLIDPQIKTLFAETVFAAARLRRPLVILWKTRPDLPAELQPIMAEAGIKPGALPPVQRLVVPYRGTKKAALKSETFYYLYLP